MSQPWEDTEVGPAKNGDNNAKVAEEDGGNGQDDAAAPVIAKELAQGVDVSEIHVHADDDEIVAAIKEKDSEDAAQEEAATGNPNNLSHDQEEAPHESNPEETSIKTEEGEDGVNEDGEDEANSEDDGSRSNNGSVSGGEEESTEGDPNGPHYPPPPHGYEHYPPPPGYYPYPPHYPPHPHYGYPPPPPGYYPPPPPGYYPPPGHPMPPPVVPTSGERDPTTGNFIYGGPPPAQSNPPKRSRMRIKTPQDIENRKIRKNAQSRHRAARLREKVETIKSKGDHMTEDEVQLYQTVEERRARKNNRSRERALEKKAELERISSKPENERTKEEIEILETAIAAKKRKNEGDRLRRERIKKMGLKVKPPGMSIHSRPRKPLSGENILPYGSAPPGMPGIPDMAQPPLAPPGIPPLPPTGTETFQYPPAPHPHSYPPPNPYYSEPPSIKEEDNSDDDGQDINIGGDDRPGSANTEQEVSELLLQDPPDIGDDEHDHVDVQIMKGDDVSGTIEC